MVSFEAQLGKSLFPNSHRLLVLFCHDFRTEGLVFLLPRGEIEALAACPWKAALNSKRPSVVLAMWFSSTWLLAFSKPAEGKDSSKKGTESYAVM